MKRSQPTRAERLAAEQAKTTKALKRSGFTKRAKAEQRPTNYWPDLSCDKPNVAPTSDRVAYHATKPKPKIAVPDGFHIGHSHKQGLAIHSNKDVQWTGGRKT